MTFGESDVSLPVKLDAVTVINVLRWKPEPSIGSLYGGAVIGVANSNAILEGIAEERQVHLSAHEELFRVLFTLIRGRDTRKNGEIIAGKKQGWICVTGHQVETECVGHVCAQLRRERGVLVTVVDSFATRGQ